MRYLFIQLNTKQIDQRQLGVDDKERGDKTNSFCTYTFFCKKPVYKKLDLPRPKV